MAYTDLVNELVGQIAGLSVFLARTFINRAWSDIRQARSWSFLIAEDAIAVPAEINVGTVAVTQFVATVVANPVAAAALTAVVAGTPTLLQRQFRVADGQIYNITAWDPIALTLTLDRIYQGATNPAATYSVYRCYVAAPTDFKRWISVFDPFQNYSLRRNRTKQEFDHRDPQRSLSDQAYYIGSYKADPTTGAPIYELWPHPRSATSFMALYARRGVNLTSAAPNLPPQIPDDLVVQRAMGWHAYPWAMANASRFPALKGVNWSYLTTDAKNAYKEQLATAIREDDDTFFQSLVIPDYGPDLFMGPIDSTYFASHGVPGA